METPPFWFVYNVRKQKMQETISLNGTLARWMDGQTNPSLKS